MALVRRPKVLLADEITTVLDVTVQVHVHLRLDSLRAFSESHLGWINTNRFQIFRLRKSCFEQVQDKLKRVE
jgi:ABC-type microcin C transport system duplicated ATPase subunit YejF